MVKKFLLRMRSNWPHGGPELNQAAHRAGAVGNSVEVALAAEGSEAGWPPDRSRWVWSPRDQRSRSTGLRRLEVVAEGRLGWPGELLLRPEEMCGRPRTRGGGADKATVASEPARCPPAMPGLVWGLPVTFRAGWPRGPCGPTQAGVAQCFQNLTPSRRA